MKLPPIETIRVDIGGRSYWESRHVGCPQIVSRSDKKEYAERDFRVLTRNLSTMFGQDWMLRTKAAPSKKWPLRAHLAGVVIGCLTVGTVFGVSYWRTQTQDLENHVVKPVGMFTGLSSTTRQK